MLPRTVALNGRLGDNFDALDDLFENPNTLLALRDLRTTLTVVRPAMEFVAPYQTVCNYWNYFVYPLGEHQSEVSPLGGTVQQQGARLPNMLQANSLGSIRSSRPVDTPPGVDPVGAEAEGMQLQRFYSQPYQPAIDAQGNADCQVGQNGYVKGPLGPNRYKPGTAPNGDRQRRQRRGQHRQLPDPVRRHVRVTQAGHQQPPRRGQAALMARQKKRRDQRGMTPFKAGVVGIVVVVFAVFMAFTKANPFANPYELKGAFETANNIKPNSPVRIAGVEVGKVKKIEPVEEGGRGEGAAIVTMELKKSALPIHQDATMKIRPRVFLEGNFFVDIKPGSPSSPKLASGKTVPTTQTAAPVQFGDVLTALQSDTRSDLQVFLKEYSKGLEGQGAEGFNEALRTGPAAFRSTAMASDALLGLEPTKDLQRAAARPGAHVRRAERGRERAQGPGHQLQHRRRRLRQPGRGAGALDPGPGPDAARRLARAGLAQLGPAHPARVLPRGAARGALQRPDAGGLAALHPPGPAAGRAHGAARHRPPAAPADPQLRHAQQALPAAAAPGAAAVLVHQQRAGALRRVARAQPRRAPRTPTRSRCARPTAASWACPARAA